VSLHFLSGKPGGGKSYRALMLIEDELLNGKRHVVTNLSVDVPALRQYHADKGKTWDLERLHIISEDQTRKFYTFRPGYRVTENPDAEFAGKSLTFERLQDQEPVGVLYVLDEVHLFFNAREFAKVGRGLTFYLSQHRKLGDDVIAVTQHVEKVDKQFRLDAQDFTFCRNTGKERFLLLFRGPEGRIVWATYLEHSRVPGNKPMLQGTFGVDKAGLGKCYNTAAGVGISARGADTGERRSGLKWYIAVPLLLLAVYFVCQIPSWVTRGIFKVAGVKPNTVANSLSNSVPLPSVTNSVGVRSNASSGVLEFRPPVYLSGIFKDSNGYSVYLSDGRVFTPTNGLHSLGNGVAVVSGESYRWAPLRGSAQQTNQSFVAPASSSLQSVPTGDTSWARRYNLVVPSTPERRDANTVVPRELPLLIGAPFVPLRKLD